MEPAVQGSISGCPAMVPTTHPPPVGLDASPTGFRASTGGPGIRVQRGPNGVSYWLDETQGGTPRGLPRGTPDRIIDPAEVADQLSRAAQARAATFFGRLARFVAWLLLGLAPEGIFLYFFGGILGWTARFASSRLPCPPGLYYDPADGAFLSFVRQVSHASDALRKSNRVEATISRHRAERPESAGRFTVQDSSRCNLPFELSIAAPCWQLDRTLLVFLPDQLAIVEDRRIDLQPYDHVNISQSTTDVPYTGGIPSDATVVGLTWRHMTRSGSPDRRYRDNPATSHVRHGQLHLRVGDRLAVTLRVSNLAAVQWAGEAMAAAVRSRSVQSLSTSTGTGMRSPPADSPNLPSVLPTIAFDASPPKLSSPSVVDWSAALNASLPPLAHGAPSHDGKSAATDQELTSQLRHVQHVRVLQPTPSSASPPGSARGPSSEPSLPHLDPVEKAPAVEEVHSIKGPDVTTPPGIVTPSRPVHSALPDEGAPPQVAPRVLGRSFAIPPRFVPSTADRTARWLGPDDVVEVHGIPIRGGLFYLGDQLLTRSGLTEPSLVSPTLAVAWEPDRDPTPIGYSPSYSTLSPARRLTHLEWLANGRRNPATAVGHVFIFFYGLERRVFIDTGCTPQDVVAIRSEVASLRDVYSGSSSFWHYASAFLEVLDVLPPIRRRSLPGPVGYVEGEPPLWLRMELALRARDKAPLDGQWALAWFDAARISPAPTIRSRCADEFAAHFRSLYRDAWGDGIVLSPGGSRLAAKYRPASSAFGAEVDLSTADLNDPTRAPVAERCLDQIEAVVKRCVGELDAYSRWLGRHPDGRGTVAGLAYLPRSLRAAPQSDPQRAFIETLERWTRCEGAIAVVPMRDVCSSAGITLTAKASRADAAVLPQMLQDLGYGIEPDIRFGGPALSTRGDAVLFRLPEGSSDTPSPEYPTALIFARLAAVMGATEGSGGVDARQHFERHIGSTLALGPGEPVRIAAHLRWLLCSPPSPASIKKSLAGVSEATRQSLASFLVGIAGADGRIDPREVEALRRLFPALGLDKDLVYSHLHAMTAQGPASTPPTGMGRHATPGDSTLPPRAPAGAVVLNPERLQSTLSQTAAVTALLGSVFDDAADDELVSDNPSHGLLQPASTVTALPVAGLDAPHSTLLRVLAQRPRWSRADFEYEATRLSLMPDGALEVLNERALDRCDCPLFDGDDPIDVDVRIAKELTDA